MLLIKRISVVAFILATLCLFLFLKRNEYLWLQRIKMHFTDQRAAWITTINDIAVKPNDYYSEKHEYEILSPVYHIDKIYKSMMGPSGVFYTNLDNEGSPHLLWLTDYSIDVSDASGNNPMSKDFMCHNNLDFSVPEYLQHFSMSNREQYSNSRFATLTEGQAEIHFPLGFGIPVFSSDKISIGTQVLNQNIENPSIDVRHRIKMGFVRESELKKPLTPLFKQTIHIVVPIDTATKMPSGACSIKQDCRPVMASISNMKTLLNGKEYTGHWIVKEGIDTVTLNITAMMHLPYNTTLHYASVHLHAYSQSLTLRDITADSIVFTSYVKNYVGKTGMDKIDCFSSTEGLMLFKNHQYELVCITNNDSRKEQDMMAVMLLYMRDVELEKNISEMRKIPELE